MAAVVGGAHRHATAEATAYVADERRRADKDRARAGDLHHLCRARRGARAGGGASAGARLGVQGPVGREGQPGHGRGKAGES